jgi:hypothetical protein
MRSRSEYALRETDSRTRLLQSAYVWFWLIHEDDEVCMPLKHCCINWMQEMTDEWNASSPRDYWVIARNCWDVFWLEITIIFQSNNYNIPAVIRTCSQGQVIFWSQNEWKLPSIMFFWTGYFNFPCIIQLVFCRSSFQPVICNDSLFLWHQKMHVIQHIVV